jgi:hypothetical protein
VTFLDFSAQNYNFEGEKDLRNGICFCCCYSGTELEKAARGYLGSEITNICRDCMAMLIYFEVNIE